ncbi:PH domain-containing protein [Alteromonas gilva]|uniref:PH domain-containing protein n=1 Tax=Alteromonas gilva TaxID=2987522 RepID=A0ABT5L5E7_9ALTE|nr:PH domain-containing protein [Alteromonas gilva]MDC8832272.1 PH domain-containing protein [Alteromonas gilva]
MGLLDALMGNASEVDVADVQEELSPILADDEKVVSAYKLIRDLIVFTSNRFMFIDKQGMTGRKVEYHSIPYKAITQFKVETAGHFDLDAELKIFVSGQSTPLEFELKSDTATAVQKSLANAMF